MQCPSFTQFMRLWVLALFCLALGVAVASPVLQSQRLHIVCSGTGAGATARLVQATDSADSADAPNASHAPGLLDCPLCLATYAAGGNAPTLTAGSAAPEGAPQHIAQTLAPRAVALRPPARAPPRFSTESILEKEKP